MSVVSDARISFSASTLRVNAEKMAEFAQQLEAMEEQFPGASDLGVKLLEMAIYNRKIADVAEGLTE